MRLALVVACALLLLGLDAAAEPRRFPIVLESTTPPDVVCVFGRNGSDHAFHYDDIQANLDGKEARPGWIYRKVNDLKLDNLSLPKPKDFSADQWAGFMRLQRKLLTEVHASLAELHDTLSKPRVAGPKVAAPACSEPQASCAPDSSPDIGKFWHSVSCARSPHAGANPLAVAFIGFDFQERELNEPKLEQVAYDGRVLTVDFGATWKGQSVFSLTVLGGTYQQSEPRLGVQTATTIELFPSCSEHTIRLPRFWRSGAAKAPANGSSKVSVALSNGKSTTTCDASLDAAGQFSMSFPTAVAAAPSSLKVSFGTPISSQFGESWVGRLPPAVLTPKALKVGFSWRVPCTFDASKGCPSADFPELGVSCQGELNDNGRVCRYDAGCYLAPSAASPVTDVWPDAVALPVAVRFKTADQLYSWPDSLVAIDQELNSFVGTESFVVEMDASQWTDQAVGDNVAGWFVTTPDGDSRWVPRVEPSEGEAPTSYSVPVPKVRCTDNVMVRAMGQRRYEERSLSIRSGKLQLGAPEDTGHRMAFGLELGGATIFPVSETGIASVGDRERSAGYPTITTGWWAAYHPRARVWAELNGGFWLSKRQTYGILTTRSEPFYRLSLFANFGLQITDRISAGLGVGGFHGEPLYHSDRVILGPSDQALGLQAILRFRPMILPIMLDLRFVGIIGEEMQTYDTDFKGGVIHQVAHLVSFGPVAVIRWDIASGTLYPVPPEPQTQTQ